MGLFSQRAICGRCGKEFKAFNLGTPKVEGGAICYACHETMSQYGFLRTRKAKSASGKFKVAEKKGLSVGDYLLFDKAIEESKQRESMFSETCRSKGSRAWVVADEANGLFYVDNPADEIDNSLVFQIGQISGYRQVSDWYTYKCLSEYVGGHVCIELADFPIEWIDLYPCGGSDPETKLSKEMAEYANKPVLQFLERLTGMPPQEETKEDKGMSTIAQM